MRLLSSVVPVCHVTAVSQLLYVKVCVVASDTGKLANSAECTPIRYTVNVAHKQCRFAPTRHSQLCTETVHFTSIDGANIGMRVEHSAATKPRHYVR